MKRLFCLGLIAVALTAQMVVPLREAPSITDFEKRLQLQIAIAKAYEIKPSWELFSAMLVITRVRLDKCVAEGDGITCRNE